MGSYTVCRYDDYGLHSKGNTVKYGKLHLSFFHSFSGKNNPQLEIALTIKGVNFASQQFM